MIEKIFHIGGKDFACPLQIQKVNPSSLAERCGMQPNDYIVKIGGISTEHLKHPDAQDLIKQQDNTLELTLQRLVKQTKIDFCFSVIEYIEVRHPILMIIIVRWIFHRIN